ncbi:MAG: hypothetical protein ACXAC5_02690 [Promethearchaeota archaeon]|jgi:hypothetical protein
MGISLSTALQIQNNPVVVGVRRHENKFSCVIMHGEEKRFRILLSSSPNYETEKDAEQAGQTIIDEIKGMDLRKKRN